MSLLSTEKLNAVQTVIVHDNCPDGLASAILVKDAFYGRSVEIVFVQHNTPEHKALEPKPGVMFIDFVPWIETEEVEGPDGKKIREWTEKGRETLAQWVATGTLVLDHHKGAQKVVEAFGENGVFADEKANPGVCGATLAYEHVWMPFRKNLAMQEVFARKFGRLAGIRDTWQRQSPEWGEACLQAAVLMFFPRERWLAMTLTDMASRWDRDFRPVGQVLLEKEAKSVKKIAENAYRYTSKCGTRVAMFDALKKSSDVAEELGADADLVIGFVYVSDPEPKLLLSTRSHTTYNCAALAAYYGGGGHTKAAGFNQILKATHLQPFEHIARLVDTFEMGGDFNT